MPRGVPDISNTLWIDGQSIALTFNRTSPTTGTLSWNIPSPIIAYNGIVITAAIKEINPSNFPTDGVRYNPSTVYGDLLSSNINNAQVVFAAYNDIITATVNITNLPPDVPVFFSAHAVSGVLTYYSTGVRSYPQVLNSESYAGDVPKEYTVPVSPTVGQVYFDENQKLMFVWSGTAWLPTTSHTVITGKFDPIPNAPGLPAGYPALGDFFYNTVQKTLKGWDGTVWNAVESTDGIPTYLKQDVGSDLSYGPRANLIDILKKQLGHPVICVELIEDHFNIAINNALQEVRRRTDTAYSKEYFFMQIRPGQGTYYLNDSSVGTDRIVDVIKIHRLNFLGLVNFAPDNIYAQQFLNQFYAPGVSYDLVSIHLIHSLSETFSLLFAGEVAFNWRESKRELMIYRRMGNNEKVLIECSCEKLEQEILLDRWMQQWIQQWAKAELMFMLAQIRGKFQSIPGPGGGLSLNASELATEAQRLQEDCLRQVSDLEVGQNGPDNYYLPFVIG